VDAGADERVRVRPERRRVGTALLRACEPDVTKGLERVEELRKTRGFPLAPDAELDGGVDAAPLERLDGGPDAGDARTVGADVAGHDLGTHRRDGPRAPAGPGTS
jgi:hypothetical protein